MAVVLRMEVKTVGDGLVRWVISTEPSWAAMGLAGVDSAGDLRLPDASGAPESLVTAVLWAVESAAHRLTRVSTGLAVTAPLFP